MDELVAIELQHADPTFSARYIEAITKTTDVADSMRLDIQMLNRVSQLRQEGKIRSLELLRPKATQMISLNSDGMRKALSDFAHSLTPPAVK